ncbi:MAG: MarR family transcriptional regulator [Candidatus Neomarinimicrobiota bacterium]|jgi:DNA-binding MarR family transcriptional regulator
MDLKKEHIPASAGRQIARLSRAAQVYFQHRFGPLGIGPAQGITLHYISMHNGIDQTELCRRMSLDKSSLATQLRKLEEHRYIIRETDKHDRRVKRIFMTPEALEIADRLHAVFTSWTDLLLKDFNNAERRKVFLLLDRLWANAGEALKELRLNETPE